MGYPPIVFNHRDQNNFEIDARLDETYKFIGFGQKSQDTNRTTITFTDLDANAAWKISVLVAQFLRDYDPDKRLEDF